MHVYCKTPLTLEMWHITTPETMTDCNMSCVRDSEKHDFHNLLDTSTLVTKKLYGLHTTLLVSRGMDGSDIYLHSGKNCNFLHAFKLLLYEAGTKISRL